MSSLKDIKDSYFLDFIETCILVYLWNRKVYPSHCFHPLRKFGVSLIWCDIAELVAYIHDTLLESILFFGRHDFKQLSAVLFGPTQIVERLEFEMIKDPSESVSLNLDTLVSNRLHTANCLFSLANQKSADFFYSRFAIQCELHSNLRSASIVVPAGERTTPIWTFANESTGTRLCVSIQTTTTTKGGGGDANTL